MRKLFFGMLVAIAGVLALPSLSAQASVSTGALTYGQTGNYLDEWYFDVNFGTGATDVTLALDVLTSDACDWDVEVWVVDPLTGLPAATDVADYNFGVEATYSGAGSLGGPQVIWGTGNSVPGGPTGPFNLSGQVRFQFTIGVASAGTTFPNDIEVQFATNLGTLVAPSGPIITGSTGVSYHQWTRTNPTTPGTTAGFGLIGSSEYFQRNFVNTSTGTVRFGSASDELAFFVDIDFGTTTAVVDIGLYSFAFNQAGLAVGDCIVELYDMQVGYDTAVATATASINPEFVG